MRHFPASCFAWFPLLLGSACATEPTVAGRPSVTGQVAAEPNCPPDPRAESVPELLFSFDSFSNEAYLADMEALRIQLPTWIEKRHQRLATASNVAAETKIFEGEVDMAYKNTLAGIEGYILKLEYLTADPASRAEKEKAFCEFIRKTIVID